MDTNRDSAHQSQNEDNFPTFSLGLEFLNKFLNEAIRFTVRGWYATNSTGYVMKQLVHALSCALSSYGARGKFGKHSRS